MEQNDLISAWLNKEQNFGNASALSFRGDDLFSYGTKIARLTSEGVYLNTKKYSSTTSRHQGTVKRMAKDNGLEVIEYANEQSIG